MPWKVEKSGDKWCVVKQSDGSTVHCHDSREMAMAQMRALYANEGKSITFIDIEEVKDEETPMSDALVFYGGAVKALGDGRVGGYGVLFTSADDPDLQGDFFTKSTALELEDRKSILTIWDHGMDNTMKRRRVGRSTYKTDDVGVWFETKLEEADGYEKAIYRLAEMGKLGWSTGSAPHLVERTPVKKAFELKAWPIIEVSLTPVPVEPRTSVQALKSIKSTTLADLIAEVETKPIIFTTKALEEALSAAYDDDLETHHLKVATAVEELLAHMTKSETAIEILTGRLGRKQEFRFTKDGRAISTQRAKKMLELADLLDSMIPHITGSSNELRGMVKLAETTRAQRDALTEAAQLQYNTFQQFKKEGDHA